MNDDHVSAERMDLIYAISDIMPRLGLLELEKLKADALAGGGR